MEFVEPALDGRELYETTVVYAGLAATGDQLLHPEKYVLPEWEKLTWQEQDAWQARADELNEARRYG